MSNKEAPTTATPRSESPVTRVGRNRLRRPHRSLAVGTCTNPARPDLAYPLSWLLRGYCDRLDLLWHGLELRGPTLRAPVLREADEPAQLPGGPGQVGPDRALFVQAVGGDPGTVMGTCQGRFGVERKLPAY